MSMNHYPAFGYYINMEEVVKRLSQVASEEWNEMDTNPADVHEDIQGTVLKEELDNIFYYGWEIVFIDDEADTAGSLYLENNEYYICLEPEQLFELKPNKLYKDLQDMELTPIEDAFCVFG